MASNFTRVAKVLVTNVQAVNTGTSIPTIADGDVLLLDRGFNEVGAAETVAGDAANESLYVALGVGAAGGVQFSDPIQPKQVIRVTRSAYADPVPMKAVIAFTAADNTEYDVRILGREQHSVSASGVQSKNYYFTTKTGATDVEVADGLAARINADKNAFVTAAQVAGNLEITAKPVPASAIDTYQMVTFDVAMVAGFDAAATITVTGGDYGKGLGQQVKDMEQATKNVQRILWPIPTETTVAQPGGKYNLVTIEHNHMHQGDLQNQYFAPLKTVIAFASADGTPSAKEAAFMTKLASVLESADTFVS